MAFFSRMFADLILPDHDFWYTGSYGAVSRSGVRVDTDRALQAAAVYSCVRVLAESVASLPLILYRRRSDGGKERAPEHPLYKVLHSQPNAWQTSFEFREMLMGHVALRGMAYAEIRPGPNGVVDQLVPLNPDRVEPKQLDSGRIVYVHRPNEGGERRLTQDEVFVVRGLSSDGVKGLSPIAVAREAIGLSLAAEEFGARLYSNGAVLSGVLEHPGKLGKTARDNLATSIRERRVGLQNAWSVMILEEGMKWQTMSMPAKDAEFLENRKFQVTEIARIFRVPPHMIGDLERATFANVEQQAIDFVVHTIRPWLVRWEQAISRDLIGGAEFFAEFLVDGLLRGDVKSRYEAYATGVQNGFLNRNEVRKFENLNPAEGLDEFLRPLNLGTVREAEETQQQARRARQIIGNAAERLANKEITAVRKNAARLAGDHFVEWADNFYAAYASDIAGILQIAFRVAESFALRAKSTLLQAHDVAVLLDEWEATRADELVRLATEAEQKARIDDRRQTACRISTAA